MMKIAVVLYDELNSAKNSDEVIEDLIKVMDSIDELKRAEFGSELRKRMDNLSSDRNAEVIFVDTADRTKRPEMTSKIKEISPDLLVTYNLAGFELCTLTDGLSYNLLDCRQFHLKDKKNLANEKYLFKEKSINMFFFDI